MIEATTIQQLLDQVCDRQRDSIRQSNDDVVRSARMRFQKDPAHRGSLHVLLASSLSRGRWAEYERIRKTTTLSSSGDSVFHRISGYASLKRNDVTTAVDHLIEAIQQDPHQLDCWNHLGKIFVSDGDLPLATEFYRRAMVLSDGNHEAAISLAKLYARQGRLNDAIHTLRVERLRDRRAPNLNLVLARLLRRRVAALSRGRRPVARRRVMQEMLDCYQVVNATRPTTKTLLEQGKVQQKLSDFSGALESYRKAVKRDPQCLPALTHLAAALVDSGEMAEAQEIFEQSLQENPRQAKVFFRYARSKRFAADSSTRRFVKRVESMLQDPSLNKRQEVYLRYAAAKVYDDLGKHEHAWRHYRLANTLKTQAVRRKRQTTRKPLERIATVTEETFTKEFFQGFNSFGSQSQMPIFIVGMPRSGTTLTEQILSSHSQVAGAGELHAINEIRFGLVREARQGLGQAHAKADCYPRFLSQFSRSFFEGQAQRYLDGLERFRTSEKFVTDKMPTNFMHLGLIGLLFPNAVIVHCRRDPMDVMTSCFCQNLNSPFCDLDRLVEYHANYRRMMRHWSRVLPNRMVTVDYEALVGNPAGSTRRLLSGCRLGWEDACLRFHQSKRAVHTPSKWQVRQPMYSSSVGRWRRFARQLAPIADRVHRQMDAEATVAGHSLSENCLRTF